MAGAIVLFVVVAVVVGVGINVYLRSWVQAEGRSEAHLIDPGTHTVAYAVPNGVDPALIMVALSRVGLGCCLGVVAHRECVRIECEPQQREQVRGIIEDVHMSAYDGSPLKVERVVFEDER
jgi:hypothetical protein